MLVISMGGASEVQALISSSLTFNSLASAISFLNIAPDYAHARTECYLCT